MAGLGAAVYFSVIVISTGAAPAPAGGEGPTPPTLSTGGEKDGLSWWKTTRWKT